MVICITRICDRYLTKGEIQRVDHFAKLMNRSYDYLQTWHDLILNHVARTNPKFAHLQRVLDEVSESFDDIGLAATAVRIKINKDANIHNSSYLSTADSRETRPSSFMNKLRQSALLTRGKQGGFLEEASQMEMSRFNTENITTQEINSRTSFISIILMCLVSFHLDEFIKYYIDTILNWASFFKK